MQPSLKVINPEIVKSQEVLERKSEIWEAAIPFDEFNLPSFPIEMLPQPLTDWCREVGEFAQVPTDLPAIIALAMLATTVQRKFEVELWDGYREQLSIYAMAALETANRKSSVFATALEPLIAYEALLAEQMKDDIARSNTEHRALKASVDTAEKKSAKATGYVERNKALADAQELAVQLARFKLISEVQLFADDLTPEALSVVMQENDERLGTFSAEGNLIKVLNGLYSGQPNYELFLKGFSGDAVKVNRKGTKRIISIRKPALSIGLAIQPTVLRELSNIKDANEKGLLGRFIYAIPKSLVGHRRVETRPVNQMTKEGYKNLITGLLEIEPTRDDTGRIVPHILKLSDDARLVFIEFAKQVEEQLRDGGELEPVKSWGGKYVGHVARIAGLIHLAEHPYDWETKVDDTTIARATSIGYYLKDHAFAAYGFMKAVPEVEDSKYVLKRIKDKGKEIISRTELYVATRKVLGEQTNGRLDVAIRVLTDRNFIKEQHKTTNGRPRVEIIVNPTIL